MSTTPTPAPASAPAKISTTVHPFTPYERVALVAVVGLALWFGVGRVENILAAHDNANLQQAKIVATAQADKNQALAQQAAQQAADLKVLADKVNAQNAALEQANVALANALVSQRKADAVMTDPQLAARWVTLVPATAGGIAPATNGLTVSSVAAHATVAQLEELPVTQQSLVNLQKEKAGEDALLVSANTNIFTLNNQVDGLKLQMGDNDKFCKTQIAVVSAQARKSKRKWFYAGVVVGFLGRQAIKTYTGQ